MATPSSSATSPSPPMPYLHPGPSSQQTSSSSDPDTMEQENRQKAVQKFMARAEVAMVTRALRARLAYASYKATHNVPHLPLRDLEAQTQSQTASFNRTIAAKRKAVGATGNYYNNPSTQGPSTSSNLRRAATGSMPPPASVSSPRPHSSYVPGTTGYATFNDAASGQRNASQAPSLFASILAPTATKQARTIHNPDDPPVPAPTRPEPSPRTRAQKTSPKTGSQAKAKQSAKAAKAAASPKKRRTQAGSVDKGKRKQNTEDMDIDGDRDVDMKAAAALTSLLRHHNRPSITGSSLTSPRSSIDGSEIGSVYSYSHFAQSSARTSAPNVSTSISGAPSSNLSPELAARTRTPPPQKTVATTLHTSPRTAPTDSEAANLMLFLATSPSPARPAKDNKDMGAYRALSGGAGLRSKGRVLFPSTSATDSGHEEKAGPSGGTSYKPSSLTRSGEASFTSSISSIGGELGGNRITFTDTHIPQSRSKQSSISSLNGDIPQLLPSAPLPLPSAPGSPAGRKETNPTLRSNSVGVSGGNGNVGSGDFNFHEFINSSPSSPGRSVPAHGTGGNHKSNLGLRADVGRKLFEEEQLRHAHALQAANTASAIGVPGQRQDDRALGAGIDLVQS